MKPNHIENDLYNYHLQYLVKQKLILKADKKYVLTNMGKEYLIELNPVGENGDTNQFKLAAICLVTRVKGEGLEILYQYRSREPFLGEMEIMAGGIKRGETALAAAKRRAFEEAGVVADFSLLGLLRKTRYNIVGKLYSDILYHVCVVTDYRGSVEQSNHFGPKKWLGIDGAIKIESQGTTGSEQLSGILEQIKVSSPNDIPLFYLEEIYRHDIY